MTSPHISLIAELLERGDIVTIQLHVQSDGGGSLSVTLTDSDGSPVQIEVGPWLTPEAMSRYLSTELICDTCSMLPQSRQQNLFPAG
jgi:hypothetical protein